VGFFHEITISPLFPLPFRAYPRTRLFHADNFSLTKKIIAEKNILLELKELESQKEIMKIRNEQLTQDVDKKSKELAVSTMNLMKNKVCPR
jgi:hypothetical protein